MKRKECNISGHEQLKELCVLAASGDTPRSESDRVRRHLDECVSCRLLFLELRDLHAVELAHAPSSATARTPEQELRLKDSILRAARTEDLRVPNPLPSVVTSLKPTKALSELTRVNRRWVLASSLTMLAACLILAVALKPKLDHRAAKPALVRSEVNPESAANLSTTPVAEVPVVRPAPEQTHDEELLRARLERLDTERARLDRLLQESQSRSAALETRSSEDDQQVASLSKDLEAAHAAEAKALQRVEQLEVERQTSQAALLAQSREIRSLNERLDTQAVTKDTNANVVEAEQDLRELVGARNLQIVDVYDTDSHGKTKRAVGRVFYSEGKSLVFYAYDLSNGHSDSTKYAYYVWGNKDGNLETVRNLGTLGTDDRLQRRWKLQVNDENVLADIDRVFVTVEAVGKLGPRPQGKKILSAYLGGPVNHP